jgi:hypothetical protein
MRTYKGMAELSFRVVVPDQVTADFRAACQQEDATQFMKMTHERHPMNDEAFMQAFISNAIRRVLRDSLAEELHHAKMGGTVSPVTIEIIGVAPEHDAPVTPQVISVEHNKNGCTAVQSVESQDDPGGALAYIASNHTPVPATATLSHGGID